MSKTIVMARMASARIQRLARKMKLPMRRLFSVALLTFTVSACSDVATTGQVTTSSYRATVATTAAFSLPFLHSEPGWHTVFQATGASASAKPAHGTFLAQHPYAILAICQGTGKLTVQFAPQGTATFVCTASAVPKLALVGTAQHPPTHEQIQLAISGVGVMTWEVLVEMQN